MSINIESEAWCRMAYLNYHCYGNSMGISADEMGEITTRWSSKLTSWQATVSNDENQYEFDDSEFQNSKDAGKKQAQENTDFDGKADTASSATQTTTNSLVGVGGAVLGVIASIKSTGAFAKKCKNPWVAAVAGGILLASAAILKSSKPNQDAANACEQLSNTELPNAQAALSDTQSDMEDMSNELIALSDEANEANEDANDQLEEEKTNYDMFKTRYEALKAKVENGVPLTEEEKAEYQELIQYMTESGENITEIQEDTTDTVGEIYEDMETYQDGYDYAAETMGEVEGVTEFAEGFDESTKKNAEAVRVASIIGAAGSAGVVTAGVAGMASAGVNVAKWVASSLAVASGAGAGILYGTIIKDQSNYKGKAETEIDIRKDTQDFNTETMGAYEEGIDAYDGWMQGVEDLELEVPDDVAPPEDTTLPPTTDTGLPEGTPEPVKPDEDPNKKKEDEPAQ